MTRIEQIRREARDIQNLLECTTFPTSIRWWGGWINWVYIMLAAGRC